MRAIQMTQGKHALVDDEDFDMVNQYRWYPCHDASYFNHYSWYAMRVVRKTDGKQTTQQMHRLIMNCPKGLQVDHIDHNGLNNCKNNLRICTNAENAYNSKPFFKKTSSRFKGVHWSKQQNKWQANIRSNGKSFYLGSYSNESDAAKAYDEAAKEYFGEFAYLNFQKDVEEKFMGLNVHDVYAIR